MTDTLNTALFSVAYIFIGLIFCYIVFLIVGGWRRRVYERSAEHKLTFFQVKLPKENEIEIKSAEHMFSNLAGFKKNFFQALFTTQYRIAFEIVAKTEGIGFYVAAPDEIALLVEKQINAAYPSAEIDIINPEEIWDRGKYTKVEELKLKGAAYYPIKGYEDMKNDSLSSITSSMTKLKENEVVAVQYVIEPAGDSWRMAGRGFINRVKARASNPEKPVNIDTTFLEGIEKKVGFPGFYTKVRLVAIAEDTFSADAHIQNMKSAFEQFTDINYNRFVPRLSRLFVPKKRILDDLIFRRIHVKDIHIPIMEIPIYLNCSVLNTVELATVFHFPNKNIETPNILWLGARRSSAPTNLPESGLFLGKSVFRGVEKKIYMNEEDRARHFYIIGQTGTGKSEFMMFMAMQDIMAGRGVAIIDPHGTDIDKILEQIPPERMEDVVLFDASDTARPIGLNILEVASEEEGHQAINAFIALLYKLYDPNHQGIMGPQLERIFRNCMLTAMADPEKKSTLVDVLRLLIDEKYSEKFLPHVTDPLVVRYWKDEVAHTSANRKGEMLGYLTSKLDKFITDKGMRYIIGQPQSAINFNTFMSEKKIFLAKLAKGKIGEENANFLGLLLMPRILSAALARQKFIEQGIKDFPPYYLFVDEFQNFATSEFATILSEARKYKLNLTITHQFVKQVPEEIKDAIMGNVGTKAVFRVGVEDAEVFEKEFEPVFTKGDIIKLPVGNCYMRLLIKGFPSVPFSMWNDWKDISSFPKYPDMHEKIVEMSRMRYGKPVEEIETFINDRMGLNEPEPEPESEISPLPKFGKGNLPF